MEHGPIVLHVRIPFNSPDHSLIQCTGNTIFEPGKEGSHYRGGGSGSGDKEEVKKTDDKVESAKTGEETKS